MKIEDIDREFRELARSLKEAQTAFSAGRYAEAEPLYARALELVEKSYGEEHEDTIHCIQYLGDCCYALKKYQLAIPLFGRLLVVQERTCGPNHADVATTLFKLARTYQKLGKVQEAESLYRRSLEVSEKIHGPCSPFVATILESFTAMLRHSQMRVAEAEAMEERLRDIRRIDSKQMSANLLLNLASSIPPGSGPAAAEMKEEAERLADSGKMHSLRSKTSKLDRERARISSTKVNPGSVFVLVAILALLAAGIAVAIFLQKTQGPPNDGASQQSNTASSLKSSLLPRSTALNTTKDGQNKPIILLSPDGFKRLRIEPNMKATMVRHGVQVRGTYENDSSTFSFKPSMQSISYRFQRIPQGLIDDEGTVLYSADAPEVLVLSKMRTLLLTAQQYYKQFHQYPRDLQALLPVANLTYTNPFTHQVCTPTKIKMAGAEAPASDIDLNDYTNLEAGIRNLAVLNAAHTREPGIIEFLRTANAPEGDSFFIRGTDRNGQYFKGSKPGTAFLVTLVQGNIKSPEY